MVDGLENPRFFLEKAQEAVNRAGEAASESEKCAWVELAWDYRRLAHSVRRASHFTAPHN
jgi:hypothetical protein